MPKKRILVTGSSGLLGSNFCSQVKDKYEIIGVCHKHWNPDLKIQIRADLCDAGLLNKAFKRVKPDLVVHCAAIIDVDRCQTDYDFSRQNNALAVKNLLSFISPQTRFIHISTDSIFDGKKGNYREDDPAVPLNNYAKCKLEGEGFVEQFSQNYVIIRTNIFGWNKVRGESLAEWVLNSLSRNKPIRMFTDVVYSPISVYSLSRYIGELLSSDFVGKLHVASDGAISKYDFGVRLSGMFGLNSGLITPISVDAFGFKAERPKNTTLDVSRAKQLFRRMPSVDEELKVFYDKRTKFL